MQTSRGKLPQPDSPEVAEAKKICEILGWIYGGERNTAQVQALTQLDEYYTNKFLVLMKQHTRNHIRGNTHCVCFTELRQAIKKLGGQDADQ